MLFFHARWVGIVLCTVGVSTATVSRLEIAERSVVLNGQPFGAAGAYERLCGKAHFTVDPAKPANRSIVDLTLAPRDADGLVHFSADLYVLRPVDQTRGNGTVLFEVVNRGKKGMLSTFNRGQGSADPRSPAHFGDGMLLTAGYTLVWLGWQHDVPLSGDTMRIEVPLAKGVSGWIRGEFAPDKPVDLLPLGDSGHVPYLPSDSANMSVTVRDGVHGERIPLNRDRWTLENSAIRLKSPAQPGRIYEFIYKAVDPPIAGLGLAAIRDLISNYKATGEAKYAIGFGTSQSAMVLRALLHEGFNADESGKKVFDGIFAHVAGGRRSSFSRFAQPSRTAGPLRNASLSPTEQFPFSDAVQTDPYTKRRDGILQRATQAGVVPLIFYTNSTYEYWGSGGSLLHTSPDGSRDASLPGTTRLYVFAGGQHGPAPFPPRQSRGQNLPNFNDYRWSLRSLLPRLQAWVASGTQPPASAYPTLRGKTLTAVERYRFPAIPGIQPPRRNHTPAAVEERDRQPPVVIGAYRALVPRVDADGNELGGVQMPEVACPIAAWTGWNLRSPNIGAADTLLANTGSYLAFPRSKAEGKQTGDSRRPVDLRFADDKAYGRCVEQAARRLSERGLLLPSDIPGVVDAAARHWQWRMNAGVRESASR